MDGVLIGASELPAGLDDVVASGWPWHGRIVHERTAARGRVELPGGAVTDDIVRVNGGFTYLFDPGLPDIQSDLIESMGGAWWGRAILRSPAGSTSPTWGGGLRDRLNNSAADLWGVPLVLRDDQGGSSVAFFRLNDVALGDNGLAIQLLVDVRSHTYNYPLTRSELGQGAGQPAMLVQRTEYAGRFFWTDDPHGGGTFVRLLDFKENRLLFAVILNGSLIAESYGYGPLRVGSDYPVCYAGLFEIEILPTILEPETDPLDATVFRLIQDRAAALGDPVREAHDVTGGSVSPGVPINRDYLERWTQTGGLLAAWYGDDGGIETVTYDRIQECTLYWVGGELTPAEVMTTRRTTTMRVRAPGGVLVDELVMQEVLLQRRSTRTVTRTISITGQDDDVTAGEFLASRRFNSEPFECYPPGAHTVAAVVSYVYTSGGSNVLEYQDIRTAWLLPYSNRMGCIALIREPYDYPPGSDEMPVQFQFRPIATPAGAAGGTSEFSGIHNRGAANGPYHRGLMHSEFTGLRWGSYNPVTDEVARYTLTHVYSWV